MPSVAYILVNSNGARDPDDKGWLMFRRYRMLAGAVVAGALLTATAVRAEARPSIYWTDQFGSAATDFPSAIASASNGDTIVYGAAGGALVDGYSVGGSSDLFLARYNKTGDRKWVVQFGASGFEYSTRTIALASNGDIIVAGTVIAGTFDGYTRVGDSDVFVARFNRNGRRLWLKQYAGSGSEIAGSVAVAPTGDIYLALSSSSAFPDGSAGLTTVFGGLDAVLTKLDRKGNLKWSRSMGTAGNEFGFGVAVSRRNEVYVVGATEGELEGVGLSGGDDDGFIAKFDKNGNQQWLNQSGDPGADNLMAVTTNSRGEVYAAGGTAALSGGTVPGFKHLQGTRDGIVVKFDRSGVVLWANQHGTAGADSDWSIAVARNGQVFVGGITDGAWGGYTNKGGVDAYVARLTPDGTAVTVRQFGTTGDDGNTEFGPTIALTGNSRVTLTSTVDGAALWGHEAIGDFDAYIASMPTP